MKTREDELGPQYAADDPFKARARLHQSRFRFDELSIREWRTYGNRLMPQDALAGKNFYTAWPGLIERVTQRCKLGDTKLYWDMLRSEHIPFNFFVPLGMQADLLEEWIRTTVLTSDVISPSVEIEFAPSPAKVYLNDNTSFDAYVQYWNAEGSRCGIGIEVKYTEKAYGYGVKEKTSLFADDSPYHRAHELSGLYRQGSIPQLRTKELKQLWRNHLLGEAMVQNGDISHFTSVLLYPQGNSHLVNAARHYRECLVEPANLRFVDQTFPQFLSTFRASSNSEQVLHWLSYLERRYVHD